ncbi:MAG: ornithine--oxo-acid transaminase [Deltaproteobacteria bacterium]|nr:ornithine--oxo-acid transaminase [Deltaproteobacteria bacterium]
MDSKQHIELTQRYSAHNYSPLEVVLASGDGAWVSDVEGNRYLDMLSAYSALNFGHQNKRILKAAAAQLNRLTMTSRAFFNDQLGPLCQELSEFCSLEMVLPMNSGAEAVETSIKAARRWGYEVKKVAENKAEIICLSGNFAGRTTTIISFSTDKESTRDFGPFTPGFKIARFGDAAHLESLISENTVAVLAEPIQGEGGVIIPPSGYLKSLREICTKHKVLLIADEIQTGLCRTGDIFACDHEHVIPDLLLLGKSLGGGVTPISAVVGKREVLHVFTPGSHGSTFGGNPFACAIAREVIALIKEEKPEVRAKTLGEYFLRELRAIKSPFITEVRGRGLFIGCDVDPAYGPAKKVCARLKEHGLLCKDTRVQTIRFAPPLVIEQKDLDLALVAIKKVFEHA